MDVKPSRTDAKKQIEHLTFFKPFCKRSIIYNVLYLECKMAVEFKKFPSIVSVGSQG